MWLLNGGCGDTMAAMQPGTLFLISPFHLRLYPTLPIVLRGGTVMAQVFLWLASVCHRRGRRSWRSIDSSCAPISSDQTVNSI
jgi:hypothetical protein